MKIIDLSQEIFPGMPVFSGHPEVEIEPADTHEARAGIQNPTTISPTVNKMSFGEHTGTHVDAYNHFLPEHRDKGIHTMPLELFFTSAFCIDCSDKGLLELITLDEVKEGIKKAGQQVHPNDTILIYTDHYRRYFGTEDWVNGQVICWKLGREL